MKSLWYLTPLCCISTYDWKKFLPRQTTSCLRDLVLLLLMIYINFHRRKPVFDEFKTHVHNLCHPWLVFRMIEFTEIMTQKDDQPFTELLNRLRTASHTEDDIKCIKSRSVNPADTFYPTHALHIFAENAPVDQNNSEHLDHLTTPLYELKATDQYPPNVTK